MTTIDKVVGRGVFFAACALTSLIFFNEVTLSQSTFPKTPGIWLSGEAGYKLNGERREQLTQSLRCITGLRSLRFAKDGMLTPGDKDSEEGGSATARRILSCSLGSGDMFIIEDHSDSPMVNFGQLDEGLRYEDVKAG